MKSLKARLLTAVVGISIILVLLFLSEMQPYVIAGAVSVVTAFMTGEYLHANKLLKKYFISVPCILFAATIPVILNTGFVYPVIAVFMILGFAMLIFNHKQINYLEFAYAMFGTLLITFGMSALSELCLVYKPLSFYFATIFSLPWMADAGGFFIGASFGKHKLCPNVSPKKTVEGAVGGVLFCVITAIALGLMFAFWFAPEYNYNFVALIILGIVDAVVSIIGDLSFSLIKRSVGIKDYSSIFPGHGGMLDRFDSIIFTAPVMAAINHFLPFVTVV